MKSKMKCGVFYDVKNVALEEREIPEITDADVLVKVLRAGICGSDTGAYLRGGMYYGVYPGMIFGHEFVGEVVEKGSAVADDIQLGDIVFVDPMRAKRAGKAMADVCGGFGEYVNVEDAKRNHNIYVLDPDIDLKSAALIEPLSVGTNGALITNPCSDDSVVVLGAGTIGLCATAGLINRGIKNVVVVDRNTWKLDIASKMGAKTINTREDDLREKLLEYCGEFTRRVLNPEYAPPEVLKIMAAMAGRVTKKTPHVDLYVDCAGVKDLLLQACDMCIEGGKYSIVSVYHDELSFNGSIFMAGPTFQGSSGYTTPIINEAIDNVTNKRTPIDEIVTAEFPIDEFPAAMEAAAYKENRNIKVAITF